MRNRFLMEMKAFILPAYLIWPSVASAVIADQPLFVNVPVQPNIFFMVDDSGSMDWEVLQSNGASVLYGGLPNSGNVDITPTPSDQAEMLESCAGYNVLYYDPSQTYTPWLGADSGGTDYADQSITSARSNPYTTGTVNLTSADGGGSLPGYFTWNDADGDGVFDLDECPDPTRAGFDYDAQFTTTAEMTAAQQTNFANWYTYYRKREYVMKSALLAIVETSSARLGLSTLHRNGGNGLEASDITTGSNRVNMQTAISTINSSGGTPLRSKLAQVGAYFEGTTATGLFGSAANSPILNAANGGSCQQNFAVLMSDGYWNGGTSPGVGNADSGDTGDGDLNNTVYDAGPYADQNAGRSNTLADVAMHYYERDLKTLLDNDVPTSPLDGNNAQHLVTYTVAFGVNGSLSANPSPTDTSFNWPNVTSNTSSTVDDIRHAAWNGRGEFLSADSPSTLIQSFSNAIASIAGRTSSASSIATSSTQLQTNSKIYQARFTTTEWAGDLLAFNLDPVTANVTALAWNAADLVPSEANRNIYTSTQSVGGGVEFDWSSASSALSSIGLVETQVEYIRGDQSNEGSLYRSRSNVLGDIVNSSPTYTKKEDFDYYLLETVFGSATYDDYLIGSSVTDKGSRSGMVYVGANDGMLHGFLGDGITSVSCNPDVQNCEGEEVFAYIPKAVHSKLSALTSTSYSHQFFVDNSPVQGDAHINFDGSASDLSGRWGTALVGTLGAGGKGIFALDISNPLNFSETDVLWDLDSTDLPDLGFTFSKASVVKLHTDINASGTNTLNNDWGVIVGNGYESTSGKAVLYVLGLRTGEVIWKKEVGTAGGNGLSSPSPVDVDGDGIIDFVYAGDLKGNMWKFDISASTNASDWSVAKSHIDGGVAVEDPLFTACSADPCTATNYQPITVAPEVIKAKGGGYLVLFGTGKYYETGDNTDISKINSFYSILDDGSAVKVSGRNALLSQTIIANLPAATTGLNYNTRATTDTAISFSTEKGWYMDLYFDEDSNGVNDSPGERVVSQAVVRFGEVIFATLIPETDPCSFGGTSYLMSINAQSGSRLDKSPFDLDGNGVIDNNDLVMIDTDGDGVVDKAVAVSGIQSNVGIISTPGITTGEDVTPYHLSGSDGGTDSPDGTGGGKLGRQSWIQIK